MVGRGRPAPDDAGAKLVGGAACRGWAQGSSRVALPAV